MHILYLLSCRLLTPGVEFNQHRSTCLLDSVCENKDVHNVPDMKFYTSQSPGQSFSASFTQREDYQSWATDSSRDTGRRQVDEMVPRLPKTYADKQLGPLDSRLVLHRARKRECK